MRKGAEYLCVRPAVQVGQLGLVGQVVLQESQALAFQREVLQVLLASTALACQACRGQQELPEMVQVRQSTDLVDQVVQAGARCCHLGLQRSSAFY